MFSDTSVAQSQPGCGGWSLPGAVEQNPDSRSGSHNSLIREDDNAEEKIGAEPGTVCIGGGNEGNAATMPWWVATAVEDKNSCCHPGDYLVCLYFLVRTLNTGPGKSH